MIDMVFQASFLKSKLAANLEAGWGHDRSCTPSDFLRLSVLMRSFAS